MGMKPPGATFHTMIPSFVYTLFHTWEMTDAEKKGVVVYLRSLEPASQGALDFSGVVNRGGTGAAAGTP